MAISTQYLNGWIQPTPSQSLAVMSSLPMPVFSDVYGNVKNTGRGKVVILSDYVKKLIGQHIGQIQGIGDCVSFGAAHAVDHTYAAEIVMKGESESWVNITSTEDLYAGGRVIIGGGRLGGSDGSIGAWQAKYVNLYGTVARGKYGSYDLSKYDPQRAKSWGMPNAGVPAEVLAEAKNHKIQTVSLVQTYEEVRDAIANGYAVTIASNQGFTKTRDKDGFLRPYGTWAHQMCLIGVDDSFNRKGVLCLNSWPYSWVSGPTRHDMPPGSFWIEADVLEKNILSNGDSWVYSDRVGFPQKALSLRIV